MSFELSSSQKTFMNNLFDPMWNQGLICVFSAKYSYAQVNEALNSLVKTFETTRLRADENEGVFVDEFDFREYPLFKFDDRKELRAFANEFINKSFEKNEQLVKPAVIEVQESTGVLLCVHHLSVDGFSGALAINYINDYLKGIAVEDIPRQTYNEHLLKEIGYKNTRRYLSDLKYWSEQFLINTTVSVFDNKRALFDYASEEINYSLSPGLFEKVKIFCENCSISAQSFFNTVYSAYIFRAAHSDSFTIGIPVLNRTTEKELNSGGLYMHIVPLLVRLSDGSFLQNAVNIEDAQMTLYRHQKFTQHDIKELLKEEGRPQNSLFDIAADYQEFEKNDDYEFEFIYSRSLSLPLEIHMQSFGGEKHNLKIRYRTAMFSRNEIETMLSSFIAIIEDALEHPDKKISELDMLSPEEKQRILCDFNDTAVEYNKDTCVYKLFEDNANKYPERTAVIFKNTVLSYQELKRLVENYAAKLTELGIKQKDVVAIHLERSHKLVAFQLAVLKIGAVFFPLDKRYPEERIRYACEDCNVKILITDENVKAEAAVIDIADFECLEAGEKSETAVNKAFCYIIYTSGSTGKPKGCMLTGKGLLNFCANNNTLETLNNIEPCVFACVNAASFDYFIAETLLPLTNGFTTVVLDDRESINQKLFADCLKKNGINVLMTTPTRLKIYFGGKENTEALGQLSCICTSGEPLTEELLTAMYEKSPEAKVYNPIGPSECSVWDMGGELNREDGIDIHIGKPIANAQIYITDKYMNPVPIGVTGEICIAGDGVGAGYINNPELTAERFIENPFGEGKLYKTGDLGYWREDGNIVFAGRNDFQVKIRGLRIELGEIESAVSAVDGVELSAAAVRRDENGEQYICVFYSGEEKSSSDIKGEIQKRLPSYMLPNLYVRLEKMPLTSSGKINRKALPEVSFVKKTDYSEPKNERERLICKAFERALSLERVGRDSDFFELGGTSLSMISVLSEEGFENISAAEFIRNPTPASLACALVKGEEKENGYLEALYEAQNAGRVLILFPFGGGGSEGFSTLVNEIKLKQKDLSVYFVRYIHSEAECERVAEEIKNTFPEAQVSFYSHCAGAAVAMKVLKKLEADGFTVVHYFAGAIIPAATKDGRSFWSIIPDLFIKNAFLKAGAGLKGLSSETQKEIIRRFRKDTDFAYKVFFEADSRFRTPLTVIISKKDIFTFNHKQAERQWKRYAENLREVKFIDTSSHYFQTDNADELSKLLLGEK